MSENNSESIERLGVYKRFPKMTSYLRSFVLGPANWEINDIQKIQDYSTGNLSEERIELDNGHVEVIPFNASSIGHHLVVVSVALSWQSIQTALKNGGGWIPVWKRSVANSYWACRIGAIHQAKCMTMYERGEAQQYLSFINIQDFGFCIGNCITLGWLDWAIRLSHLSLEMLDIDGFNDGGDDFGRRRTQHFLLRLVSNWQGWPERNMPVCAYDEPLFNALIKHWRTEDMELIQHLLLCACDRHTHQARQDNSKGQFFDFAGSGGDAFYVPFEILSVLRLRKTLGLPNPELDHPIMNTPLGKLMEPSEPYTDELLEGVIARACLEFPELCKGTNIQPAVPVPPSGPTAPAAKSWLGKLLGKS